MNVEKKRSFSYLLRQPILWLLIAAVLVKLVTTHPKWIEQKYSTGIYTPVAGTMRVLFGWLPFSAGDILYTVAGGYLIIILFKFFKRLVQRKITRASVKPALLRFVVAMLIVYIYFNLAWGLNYNRLGIAHQLQLVPKAYTVADLKLITAKLSGKLNALRQAYPDSILALPPYQQVFDSSGKAYERAAMQYPWLKYQHQSIKKSSYGRLGNYLGFLGYYNPFTGEAQLNLTIPRFLVPYVTCHEIGHQLGYASESEASFVGYLAAVHSRDSLYHYSTYFDLFSYANRELGIRDSASARVNFTHLNNRVKGDFYQLRDFLLKTKNPFEPLVKMFYDQYLKANQQEKGMESYNEVVAWLIAYDKKFGTI
jgi:hypothetical protein